MNEVYVDSTKDQRQNITEDDIFKKIWTSPRAVFSYLEDNKYNKYVPVLLMLIGIIRAIDKAVEKDLGDKLPLVAVLAVCVFAGGILGWVTVYLYGALVAWTGKLLKGVADARSVVRVLAYGMVPAVCTLFVIVPQIAIFGNDMFKDNGSEFVDGFFANLLFYGGAAIEVVLGVWSTIIIVIGISEVQKLTISKAILNVLLAALAIIIPFMTIALVFELAKLAAVL